MKHSLFSSLFVSLYGIAVFASPIRNGNLQGFEALNAVGAESSTIQKDQDNWSIIRNELAECKPVTVIFARGTIELGNVGSITGPPFFNALNDLIGEENIAIQGVDYPADIIGYLKGGDPGGAAQTASLLEQAASECPDTQVVLSGYSQGAQVVHLGEAQVSAEVAARIAAVVSLNFPPWWGAAKQSLRLSSEIPLTEDLFRISIRAK